ncbi:hypothetical protein VP01_3093g3 [Puccinia sorghi]|uniref:Uncharacterized protein n=1 Tax=Puccinia sorghi TaxID=27349 RepID=A0A0L6UZP0_9BASI|nr:hypothetical protein VP01_3093g3 [Puccinia sorghi]
MADPRESKGCKQQSVTYSSTKAKLNLLVDSFHECLWPKALLMEIWSIQMDVANDLFDDKDLNEQLMMSEREFKKKMKKENLIDNKQNRLAKHFNRKILESLRTVLLDLGFAKHLCIAIYSDQTKQKLDPRGKMGKLLGFNVDLKSYKIFTSDGQIMNTKNAMFLNFKSNHKCHMLSHPDQTKC